MEPLAILGSLLLFLQSLHGHKVVQVHVFELVVLLLAFHLLPVLGDRELDQLVDAVDASVEHVLGFVRFDAFDDIHKRVLKLLSSIKKG